MLRVRSVIDFRGVLLLTFMGCIGASLAFAAEHMGPLVVAIVMGLMVFVSLLPASLNQAVTRLTGLRKRLNWWHCLWLVVFLSGFQFRDRDVQQITTTAVDSGAAYRIAFMAITACGLGASLAFRKIPRLGPWFKGLLGLMATYALVSAASTLWSVYPAWTLYKSFEYLLDVILLVVILAAARSPRGYKTLLDWTWTLIGLLVALVWLGALVWPSEALQPSRGLISVQLNGVMPQVAANGVGELGALLSLIALSRLLLRRFGDSGRAFYWLLLAVGLATMIIAQTRSAVIGFMVGLVLLLYFSKRVGTVFILLAMVVLLASVANLGGLAKEYLRRGQSDELLDNLSGRTIWWDAGWDVAVKNPWLGAGAYTSRFTVLAKMGEREASSLHNTYLETIVGVGIIGLIPLVAAILGAWTILLGTVWREAGSSLDRQMAVEVLSVLGLITSRSFFTTSFVLHPDLVSLAVLGYAALLQQRRDRVSYRPRGGDDIDDISQN